MKHKLHLMMEGATFCLKIVLFLLSLKTKSWKKSYRPIQTGCLAALLCGITALVATFLAHSAVAVDCSSIIEWWLLVHIQYVPHISLWINYFCMKHRIHNPHIQGTPNLYFYKTSCVRYGFPVLQCLILCVHGSIQIKLSLMWKENISVHDQGHSYDTDWKIPDAESWGFKVCTFM
jgi:hypothetical protein